MAEPQTETKKIKEGDPTVGAQIKATVPSADEALVFENPFPSFVSLGSDNRLNLAIQDRPAISAERFIPEQEKSTFKEAISRVAKPFLAFAPGGPLLLFADPDIAEFISAVNQVDATHSAIANIYAQNGFQYDPEWRLPEEDTKEGEILFSGIPTDFIGEIAQANSSQQAKFISDTIRSSLKAEQIIAEAGGVGLGARIALNFLDPIALGVGFISGGASFLTKATRLRNFVRVGTKAGAFNATIEAVIVGGNPIRDTHDIFYAALLGFTLGGTISLFKRPRPGVKFEAASSAYEETIKREEFVMASRGKPPQTVEELIEIDEIVRASKTRSELFTTTSQEALLARQRGSVGAAAVDPRAKDIPLTRNGLGSDWDLDAANPRAKFIRARPDVSAILNGAEDAGVRRFGKLVREGVGFEETEFIHVAASEDAMGMADGWRNRFYQSNRTNYRAWLKANGHGRIKGFVNNEVINDFNTRVGRTMVGERPDGPGSEFVKTMADDMRVILDDVRDRAERFDVFGARDNPRLPDYFPRRPNYGGFVRVNDAFGTGQLEDFFSNAMIKDVPGYVKADYDALAKVYVTRHRERAADLDDDFLYDFNLFDKQKMSEFLDGVLPQKEIDKFLKRIDEITGKKTGKRAPVSPLKHRIKFDELYNEVRLRKDGIQEEIVFNDLFDRNARIVLENYIRVMSGHISVAKNMGIKSQAEFNSEFRKLKERRRTQGPKTKITQTQLDTIEGVYNHVIGRSLEAEPGSFKAQLGRVLRDYQYTRVGGLMGLSQMPDLGDVVLAPRMFRSFIQHMPELKTLMIRMQNGKLKDPLARELEEVGIGGDIIRDNSYGRYDELGYGSGYGRQPDTKLEAGLQKAANLTAKGARITQLWSGISWLDGNMRLSTGKQTAQLMVDLAFKVAKGPKAKFIREKIMMANGIPEKEIPRVLRAIRETATVSDSFIGPYKIRLLNFTKMKDLDAADMLISAIRKETNIRVLRPDIGGSIANPVGVKGGNPLISESTFLKILLQFQKFNINAYSAKTLRALKTRDIDALGRFFGSMLFATLSYMIYTYAVTVGDPKERKKRLSLENIAAATFARSGYASVLPGVYDTGAEFLGFEPIFSYTRSSGLAKDFLTGNPTVSFLGDLGSGASGILRALTQEDYQFSLKDIRNIRRAMFFQNMAGIGQLLDIMEQNLPLPESSKEGESENVIN